MGHSTIRLADRPTYIRPSRYATPDRSHVMKFGVIVFPGSNCDHDAYHVAKHVFGHEARFIWHKESDLGDVDLVIVPEGSRTAIICEAALLRAFHPL